MKKLQNILSHFPLPSQSFHCASISAGHINDSYWVYLEENPAFVLQRINSQVFPDTENLGRNMEQVSKWMKAWTEQHYPKDSERRFVEFIQTNTGKNSLQTEVGNWRLMVAIRNSVSYEVVENPEQACEAGRLFGEFWVALSTLSVDQITPTIDRFHDLAWRWGQLQEAYNSADDVQKVEAEQWVKQAKNVWEHLAPTIEAIESGTLPQRIVHNDAKLSNALFDPSTNQGLCVIDLDTVMPGYVLYDFGDMVRSMCCPVAEDSTDLAAIQCDMNRFNALAKGYLSASASHITSQEVESLVQAGTYMSLIMGMRFLADFLQGSIYYKTTYPGHNLDRARNQITLAMDLKRQEKQLHSTLQELKDK